MTTTAEQAAIDAAQETLFEYGLIGFYDVKRTLGVYESLEHFAYRNSDVYDWSSTTAMQFGRLVLLHWGSGEAKVIRLDEGMTITQPGRYKGVVVESLTTGWVKYHKMKDYVRKYHLATELFFGDEVEFSIGRVMEKVDWWPGELDEIAKLEGKNPLDMANQLTSSAAFLESLRDA